MERWTKISKLMIDQLKDVHSAEKQLLRAMPKMMKQATNAKLKQGFQMHIDQTEGQVERWNRRWSSSVASPAARCARRCAA